MPRTSTLLLRLLQSCAIAGGFEHGDEGINGDHVGLAWSHGCKEYDYLFSDVSGLDGVGGRLHALVSYRFAKGGDSVTAVGRFTSVDAEKRARGRLETGDGGRLNLRQCKSVSDAAKANFAKYVNSTATALKRRKTESKK